MCPPGPELALPWSRFPTRIAAAAAWRRMPAEMQATAWPAAALTARRGQTFKRGVRARAFDGLRGHAGGPKALKVRPRRVFHPSRNVEREARGRAGSSQCTQDGGNDVELERAQGRERIADELGLLRDRVTVGTLGAGRRPDLLANAEVHAGRSGNGLGPGCSRSRKGAQHRARLPENITAEALAATRETNSPMTATTQRAVASGARTHPGEGRRAAPASAAPIAMHSPPAHQARRWRFRAASEPARTRRLASFPMTPPAAAMPPGTRTVSTARREPSWSRTLRGANRRR